MVAAGDVWEGHELLNEERGLLRHFLARQVGDTGALVWLHLRDGARLDAGLFDEEIARLQRLAGEVPEVVPVLYGGVNGDVAWAASPVLGDAIPLIDATRGSDLGPADLKALIDVGRCLVSAHERSVIHGALSPDRVFIGGDGRTAITHFGFARLFQLGPEDARQDPYGYAPPELFSGGRLGPRADVYGFGTIMYELLCKRALSPWTRPPSFPSGIPRMLQVMMQRALEENPNRRQRSVDEILSVLTPFARAWEELGAPPAPPHADILAGPASARREPHEAAPILVEDEASAFASEEEGGRAASSPRPALPTCPPRSRARRRGTRRTASPTRRRSPRRALPRRPPPSRARSRRGTRGTASPTRLRSRCGRLLRPSYRSSSRCCRYRRCPRPLRVLRCCRYRRCPRPLRAQAARQGGAPPRAGSARCLRWRSCWAARPRSCGGISRVTPRRVWGQRSRPRRVEPPRRPQLNRSSDALSRSQRPPPRPSRRDSARAGPPPPPGRPGRRRRRSPISATVCSPVRTSFTEQRRGSHAVDILFCVQHGCAARLRGGHRDPQPPDRRQPGVAVGG
ncbi:protein kinase domain-containing protein [Sorangium sp. So ce542]|uniref:protein kinase domain-containing protein n=1 Tax=Sorangium sp. So ce542 TaxID=3133316 RepID=UPI003F618FC0